MNRQQLRELARAQRNVLLALLANIVFTIAYFAVIARLGGSILISLLVFVVAIAITVYSVMTMYRLASRLYSNGVAILFCVLLFAPCASLLALALVVSKASNVLNSHGIKVGLLGVNPNSI